MSRNRVCSLVVPVMLWAGFGLSSVRASADDALCPWEGALFAAVSESGTRPVPQLAPLPQPVASLPFIAPPPAAAPGSEPQDASWPALTGEAAVEYGVPITTGFVVWRGSLVPPPYRVGVEDGAVWINGQRVATVPRPTGGDLRTATNALAVKLERWLLYDAAVMLFDESVRVVTDSESAVDFLRELLKTPDVEERVRKAVKRDFDGAQAATSRMWHRALLDLQLDPRLIEFVSDPEGAALSAVPGHAGDEAADSVASTERAPKRLASHKGMLYSSSVAGMLLVVVSTGTLLNHRPKSGRSWSREVKSVLATNMLKRCLILIVVLSAFDLACTLLFDTTGQFSELNPLAASLFPFPGAVAMFKLMATGLGIGILWYLRRFQGAQLASWWLCLLLTLLTVRWITVQSLFFV